MRRAFAAIVAFGFLAGFLSPVDIATAHRKCPERPKCRGCGCAGGPGWRGPLRANGKKGKCVGFKNINRICGQPHTRRCIFENAPGTGLNKSCVHKHPKKRKKRNLN